MDLGSATVCGIVGLAGAAITLYGVIRLSPHWRGKARPIQFHHTHSQPVPRLGGLGFAAAFVVLMGVIGALFPSDLSRLPSPLVFVLTALAMFGLGLWDDFHPLGARKKLIGQVLIASAAAWGGYTISSLTVPFGGGVVHLGQWGLVATVLWLVGLTNLINLIDGIDGLAGGIGLMLMLLLTYVGAETQQIGLLAAGLTGALVAFLWFNFPPARIYMGDGGAYFLGFLIGLMTIASAQKGTVIAALVSPLFVLALPIVDTAVAVVRRGVQGLPLFRPDRKHIHHRLIASGIPRRRVVLGFYALTLVFLVMAFAAVWSQGRALPTLIGLAVLILLVCAGRLGFSREWFAVLRVLNRSLHIRSDVEYAQCLIRSLEFEARRNRSFEELWSHYVFVASRLGFSLVRFRWAEQEWCWERPGARLIYHGIRHRLHGRHGIIEFHTGLYVQEAGCLDGPAGRLTHRSRTQGLIRNHHAFEVLSELMAEGWSKAIQNWEICHNVSLSTNPRTSAAKAQPVAA